MARIVVAAATELKFLALTCFLSDAADAARRSSMVTLSRRAVAAVAGTGPLTRPGSNDPPIPVDRGATGDRDVDGGLRGLPGECQHHRQADPDDQAECHAGDHEGGAMTERHAGQDLEPAARAGDLGEG